MATIETGGEQPTPEGQIQTSVHENASGENIFVRTPASPADEFRRPKAVERPETVPQPAAEWIRGALGNETGTVSVRLRNGGSVGEIAPPPGKQVFVDPTTLAYRNAILSYSFGKREVTGQSALPREASQRQNGVADPGREATSGPISHWEFRGTPYQILNPSPQGEYGPSRLYIRGDHRTTLGGTLAENPWSQGPETVIEHVRPTQDGGWEMTVPGPRPGPRYTGTGEFIKPVRKQ